MKSARLSFRSEPSKTLSFECKNRNVWRSADCVATSHLTPDAGNGAASFVANDSLANCYLTGNQSFIGSLAFFGGFTESFPVDAF